MAKRETNEIFVHGENVRVLYERPFGKFLREINEMNFKKGKTFIIWVSVALFAVAALQLNYFLWLTLVFMTWSLLYYIKKVYVPRRADLVKIGCVLDGPKKKPEYFLHLGDATRRISDIPIPADVKKETPEKLEYPILIDFDTALRHMFVVGTTGSGKTTFSIALLKQHLAIGGGAIIVDGKGDKDIYTDIVNTCIAFNREDDISVINFNAPTESNKMNPLLVGETDDISNMLGNLVESGGDNAIWAGRAMSMMNGILSCLVPLRDSGELYDPLKLKIRYENDYKQKIYKLPVNITAAKDGSDIFQPIMTFKVLSKFLELESLRDLYFRMMDRNNMVKEGTYEGNGKRIEVSLERLGLYLVSCSTSIKEDAREQEIPENGTKMHGNSNVMWNEALDLFTGAYGDIFNTDSPDLTLQDVVYNSRFVYVLLPATKKDPRTLSILGKVILALLKQAVASLLGDKISGNLEERAASSAIRPVIPFLAIMDEYGAYAVQGFDNVLAQARSLRVCVIIEVQEIASLEKGGEIDKKRLLGNTAVKVILKVEDNATAKELAEMIGTEKQADVQQQTEGQEKKSFSIAEKSIIDPRELAQMKGGHGYVRFSGETTAMLAGFYEPPMARYIQEFNTFNELTSQNYVVNLKVDEMQDKNGVMGKYNPRDTNSALYTEFDDDSVNLSDEMNDYVNAALRERKIVAQAIHDMKFGPKHQLSKLIEGSIDTRNAINAFINDYTNLRERNLV